MKRVIITEEQEKNLARILNEEIQQIPVPKSTGKPYTIDPDKVLVVKKFLDNNFKKGNLERIGANGMPEKVRIVTMFASNGEPLKSLYEEDLQDLLIEKFKNMFTDKLCRKLFLKQVMKDWFDDKIGVFGNLSVNRLMEAVETSNVNIYYHGGNLKDDLWYNGVLWLTPQDYYAKSYAEHAGNPTIWEVKIDESKINAASLNDMGNDAFDPYYPDKKSIQLAINEGYNAYYMDYDSDDAEGLCLLSTEPVVSVRQLSEEEYNMIEDWEE